MKLSDPGEPVMPASNKATVIAVPLLPVKLEFLTENWKLEKSYHFLRTREAKSRP